MNPVKEEEAEEGVVKRKVVKEKEEDNDEVKVCIHACNRCELECCVPASPW